MTQYHILINYFINLIQNASSFLIDVKYPLLKIKKYLFILIYLNLNLIINISNF